MATLTLTDKAPEALKADAVVVGVAKGEHGLVLLSGTGSVDAALDGRLGEALTALGARGTEGEVTTLAGLGALSIPVIAAVGLGPMPPRDTPFGTEAVRYAAGAACRALAGRRHVVMTLPMLAGASTPDLVRATAEGAALGAYEFRTYRDSDADHPALPEQIELVVSRGRDKAAQEALAAAIAVGEAVSLARDLVNTAPNDLPPAEFAARAQAAGRAVDLDVEILDEKALQRGGYGGILGVGGGSQRPPRLVRLHYKGPRPQAKVALVGKGITFDSGGISLKPSDNMHVMKSDMAGAAATVAAIVAAARLKLPLEITATVPMAENLPGGGSYRPGDVLRMYGGATVEVLNTDAEGRLVLADAIVRACEDDPAYLMETSTLTGAQIVSLGSRTAGVMGSDGFRDRVSRIGAEAGEPMWAMPLPPELRKGLDSTVADLANVAGNRAGGMLVAGHFLAHFVQPGVQWAHLDVAGPAFNSEAAWGYTPKGGTGVPVRTLVAALQDIAESG